MKGINLNIMDILHAVVTDVEEILRKGRNKELNIFNPHNLYEFYYKKGKGEVANEVKKEVARAYERVMATTPGLAKKKFSNKINVKKFGSWQWYMGKKYESRGVKFRIYVNILPIPLGAFILNLLNWMNNKGLLDKINFGMKHLYYKKEREEGSSSINFERCEKLVIYFGDDVNFFNRIVNEFLVYASDKILIDRVPIFAHKIKKGIAWGIEPEIRGSSIFHRHFDESMIIKEEQYSFGTYMSHLVSYSCRWAYALLCEKGAIEEKTFKFSAEFSDKAWADFSLLVISKVDKVMRGSFLEFERLCYFQTPEEAEVLRKYLR